MRKKRILFLSNYLSAKTGFGGFMRELIGYLYPLDKYEIAVMGSGLPFEGHPDFQRWPVKCYGTIPTHLPEIMNRMNQDPNFNREISYGMFMIDEAIKDFKPDIFAGIEDIWFCPGIENKKWVKEITPVIHTTLDSLPILPRAYEVAKHIKNFFVWSEFAERAMKANGANNVKTIHGTVNTKVYNRLGDDERRALRQRWGLTEDTFVVGMLSRNQLRKHFPILIEGFAKFKKENPNIKTKLLLFTHYGEGWDLEKHRKDAGLAPEDILCCYKCRATGMYFVLPFQGREIDNPVNGAQKSLITCNTVDGLTDRQVNEWYNLLDVFCHPITSGALERSVSEAKLTEIPVLINPYSCFEDQVGPNSGAIELEQSFYFEIGTDFKKATVCSNDIKNKLLQIYNLSPEQRREIGKQGRQFVLDFYSIEKVGKQFEELFDSLPYYEGDWSFFDKIDSKANAKAVVPDNPNIDEWLRALYLNILGREPDNEGFQHWRNAIAQTPQHEINRAKKQIEDYFRQVAVSNGETPKEKTPEEFLREAGVKEDAVLICFQKSAGDCLLLSSLFRSLREQYPNRQLVLSAEEPYHEIFDGNPNIDLVIPWQEWMRNQLFLQGRGKNKPLVFKSLHPNHRTQVTMDYYGNDNLNVELKYAFS